MDKDKILKNLEEMKAELSDMMDRVALMYDAIFYCGIVEEYDMTYTEAISAIHKGEYVKCKLWEGSDYCMKAAERGFVIGIPWKVKSPYKTTIEMCGTIRDRVSIEEMNSLWKIEDCPYRVINVIDE